MHTIIFAYTAGRDHVSLAGTLEKNMAGKAGVEIAIPLLACFLLMMLCVVALHLSFPVVLVSRS